MTAAYSLAATCPDCDGKLRLGHGEPIDRAADAERDAAWAEAKATMDQAQAWLDQLPDSDPELLAQLEARALEETPVVGKVGKHPTMVRRHLVGLAIDHLGLST